MKQLVPPRIRWILATVLAPLGGIGHLVWPGTATWVLGVLAVLPLLLLAMGYEERRGRSYEPPEAPWAPPHG